MRKNLTNCILGLACALQLTGCQTPSIREEQSQRDYLKLTIEESGTKRNPIFSVLNAELLKSRQVNPIANNSRARKDYIETRNERGETLDKVPLYPKGYSPNTDNFIAENFSGQGRVIQFRNGTFETVIPYNPAVAHFYISSQNTKTNIPVANIKK
ncbi:MAG: hypothetical protein AABW80_02495 [Nanoarchaeota archaeon]